MLIIFCSVSIIKRTNDAVRALKNGAAEGQREAGKKNEGKRELVKRKNSYESSFCEVKMNTRRNIKFRCNKGF